MSPPRVVQAAYVLIVLLQIAWHAVLQPPHGNGSWMLAAVATVPLLMVAPGILEGKARSMTWGAYLLVLYFIFGIMEAWSNPPQRALALSQVLLTIVYFTFLLLLVRQKR